MARKTPNADTTPRRGAAIISHTTVAVAGPQSADINVLHARSNEARLTVNLGSGMMLTFLSADATQGLLEAIAAARAHLANVPYELGPRPGPETEPAVRSTLAIEWIRRPMYSATAQHATTRAPHAKTVHWVDVHTEAVTWQIRDITGLRSLIEALRQIHRTAAAVFLDGHEHRKDPSADEPLTPTN